MSENPVDQSRVHFLGKVDYSTYCKALQVSAVHIYLTYPFVLSWSLLEALASGCVVIASDTAPVREVIRHDDNGWLVNFFDSQKLVEQILYVLVNPELSIELRKQAFRRVQSYSVYVGIQSYMRLIKI